MQISTSRFFVRGDRHIKHRVDERGSPRNNCRRMLVDSHFPVQLATERVEGISVRSLISEIGGPAAGVDADTDRSTDRSAGLEDPYEATRLGVQRIILAVGATSELPSRTGATVRIATATAIWARTAALTGA